MKISFSTLGCPGWTWEEMLVTAKDLGFDGIEIRGIENELYVPKAKPFAHSSINATKARLEKLGIEIPILTSSSYLCDKVNIDTYLDEAREYIDLAQKLNVPYVRVLGDREPEPGEDIDTDFVANNLKILGEYAQGRNVKVLVETNGVYSRSENMLDLLHKVDSPNIGVVWDIHHPFRHMGEQAEITYRMLKDYIMHVHVKDSVVENGKVKYRMMGYGDIPVNLVTRLLKDNHYDGYISLEWVKRWCMDLEEPGVVFSHFISYMHRILA